MTLKDLINSLKYLILLLASFGCKSKQKAGEFLDKMPDYQAQEYSEISTLRKEQTQFILKENFSPKELIKIKMKDEHSLYLVYKDASFIDDFFPYEDEEYLINIADVEAGQIKLSTDRILFASETDPFSNLNLADIPKGNEPYLIAASVLGGVVSVAVGAAVLSYVLFKTKGTVQGVGDLPAKVDLPTKKLGDSTYDVQIKKSEDHLLRRNDRGNAKITPPTANHRSSAQNRNEGHPTQLIFRVT